ncbi:MAG: carbohydrate binding domain-containing protein [Prevotella sp.]|nr:carbohydrate binding domain-containing protein [Prevotella sp.]
MKTFKQRLMLVATLMVIAVSGYAATRFVNLLEGDNTNFDNGTRGNWGSWGNSSTWGIVTPGYGDQGKCLKLTNPSPAAFYQAQLAYQFNNVLDQSKKYTFRFKAKCESGSGSHQLQFIYQNNDYSKQTEVKTFDITGEWDSYEIENVNLDFNDANRILINFGKDQITFYIDDIEFGYYEEVQDPNPDPTPDPTPTGSLNNTMYYDGAQWCLMLEDFEGKTIGDSENFEKDPYGSVGSATVAADPLGNSNKSLNFITGNYKSGDYYYIDVTLPNSKTLSESNFTNLIFDIVFNKTGDNNYKDLYVKINNTSTELRKIRIENANTTSWSQQSCPLTGKYTDSNTFRIYIGGIGADNRKANLYIDNIRLSVPTTPETIGTCGKTTQTDAGWMLDGNTLYISGKGDIADYEESSSKLWSDNKDNISNVIIGEGITAIGKQNFYNHNGLESVVLPSTLKQIGEQGLYARNENNKIQFTFHSNPTMGTNALNENSDSYTATLVLDDALSPYFAAKSDNTFNGGIQYKRTVSTKNSTITLPFKPLSGMENCTFYELNSEQENVLIFEEVSKTNLVAGNPYIMVMTEPTEIVFSPESNTIPANAVASETTIVNWTMHGTYSTLKKYSEDNAYGFTENELRKNTGTMTVKPFRAYFTTSINNAKDYLNVLFGGEVTGIERNEFSPEGITEIFSLDGKKHDCLQKGMNIVKMNNGSIKKIVIK